VSTALLLPGRAYTPVMPALFLASLALRDAGLEPVAVEWPAPEGVLVPPDEIRRTVAAAIEEHHPTVVVAKSMGTHAAPVVADHGIDAVWLTPLLDDAVCRAAIERHPGRQLLVGGSADPMWVDLPAVPGATVVEIPGADHGFCTPGDAVASAEAHVTLTRAITEFLAS
jgi:hypothetical protein